MSSAYSRRGFLAALTCGIGTAGLANAPAVSLRPVARPSNSVSRAAVIPRTSTGADALIGQAKLGGQVAFSVVDVKSGLVLEEYDANAGLPPASVTKSITALYALEVLGADHRFSTRLIATGAVKNGVLNGDLILAGGGDPTLDTDGLARLAAQLKSAGVREVTGTLRPYGAALPKVREVDRDQPDHVAYNPAISGLNLNFNRVYFEWKRNSSGYAITMDARTAKYRPEVRVARMSIAERGSPVYSYNDAGSYDAWSVSRKALGKGGARWLPTRKPEAYAMEVFATLARSHGIVLQHGKPLRSAPSGITLATEQSKPLRDILKDMLKYSNNMTAEAVGLSATIKRKGRAASLKASGQEMSSWARTRLGMSGVKFIDHSGLGSASRVTASAMARAMAKVHKQGMLKPILKPFQMRNKNGKVDKKHPIKVLAKTGTLYFVSSLSGYMTAKDGTELAFAILTVNDKQRAQIDRKNGTRPQGSRSWNSRSRKLQRALIERWGAVYGS